MLLPWLVVGVISTGAIILYKEDREEYSVKRKDIVFGIFGGWLTFLYMIFFFLRELWRSYRSGALKEWMEEEL